MGVHSLWNILEPSARPVRLESLSRKRMAVDASIWIYQFLKAVRTAEGGGMKASHVVGFFRRICKLLYFGILPVFVFDGGAPILKREVIRKRKERRQGKREGAEKTAQKLLAIQLHKQGTNDKVEGKKDENITYQYLDENGDVINPKFKTSDEYDLPHIEGFQFSNNDERFVSEEEYKSYKEQVEDDLEGIDLNTIDPASQEFEQLPLTSQYMVLSQLRIRSRLRMGYTKEQLENIFPASIDFSKFQIQMVQKRNYFTQRLMGISGMGGANEDVVGRVASTRDREYRIQKTEGGWALSLEDDSGNSAQNPVDLEKEAKKERGEAMASDDEIEWEDISLENKEKKRINQSISSLPLPPSATAAAADSTLRSFTFSPSKAKSKRPIVDQEINDEEVLEQIEELELKQAIQESKDELKKQRELEQKMLEQLQDEDADAVFEDIPFSFGDKPKMSASTMMPPPVFTQGASRSQEERIQSERDQWEKLNPVTASKVTPAPKVSLPSKTSMASQVAPPPKVSLPPRSVTPDVSPAATKSQKPSLVETSSSIPNGSILNSYQQKQKDAIAAKKDAEASRRHDASLGLVSWSEAQEILQSQNEDPDDVQIVEQVDITGPSSAVSKSSVDVVAEEPVAEEKDGPTPAALEYEFYESEEEEMTEQLEKERQEHEQFQKDLNPYIMAFIDDEKELRKQQRREMRDADEVTVVMIREVQDLLSRFGIPYITAPMEAEAQCAELLKLELVDGIITDDSDVFLFGGDRVYRNMFHEKHYVEFYDGAALERLGLDKKKLIELAHLLGSDYTEGLKGVGPVLGMEILAQFGGLEKFRDWFLDGQFDLEKQKKETSWEKSLRKKLLKNDMILDKTFPDKRIDQAYLAAEVDHDKTAFVWGKPDLDQLRSFLMSTVGWSQARVDQVLVPLIQDLNKKKREGTQSTLGEFYDVDTMVGVKRKRMNKRMEDARTKMVSRRKI